MDKFDYITATIEEEKIRLEKIINYLKETNNLDELPELPRYKLDENQQIVIDEYIENVENNEETEIEDNDEQSEDNNDETIEENE